VPYLANIDGVIWLVIIVVSIISQIAKATRKVSANAPGKQAPRKPVPERKARPAPAQRAAPVDRAEELRQFFENLGMPVPAPVAPAAPPARHRKKSKPAATPVAPVMVPAPAPEEVPARPEHVELVRRPQRSAETQALAQLLLTRNTQRQAILLREILGPPLALR